MPLDVKEILVCYFSCYCILLSIWSSLLSPLDHQVFVCIISQLSYHYDLVGERHEIRFPSIVHQNLSFLRETKEMPFQGISKWPSYNYIITFIYKRIEP
jgi:hypothetical protein